MNNIAVRYEPATLEILCSNQVTPILYSSTGEHLSYFLITARHFAQDPGAQEFQE